MSDVHWIKLKTEMFSDEKIRLIESMPEADTIIIVWVKLLIQAGKTNANGYIFLNENVPFTPEMLATLFNRPLSVVRLALKTLLDFGMISIDGKGEILINNWEKHQNVEGLDRVREQGKIRQAGYRKRQKLLIKSINNDINTKQTLNKELEKEIDTERCVTSNVTVTLSEKDELFETFWEEYPRKISRKNARNSFIKVCKNGSSFNEIMKGLLEYKNTEEWLKGNVKYIPHPSSWLNGERWNDEIIPHKNNGNSSVTKLEGINAL